MILNYKNTPLFFSAKGIGNPLVLLHGFLESSKIWDPFVEELSQKRQVITIDLPGHGLSGNLDNVHSMELMADAVRHTLLHLNIDKASFVGHSMGGYVCLAFYEKFPTMTKGLVLLNSTPEADSDEKRKNRERSISIIKRNKKAFVSMAISNLLSQENNIKFQVEVENLKNEALKFSEKGIIAALKGMKIRTDRKEVLARINPPKTIIAGEQDYVLDYQQIQQVAINCNTKFISFPDGHLSYIENKKDLTNFMHLID